MFQPRAGRRCRLTQQGKMCNILSLCCEAFARSCLMLRQAWDMEHLTTGEQYEFPVDIKMFHSALYHRPGATAFHTVKLH